MRVYKPLGFWSTANPGFKPGYKVYGLLYYKTISNDKSIKSERNHWHISIFALGSSYTGLYTYFYYYFLYKSYVSQTHPHNESIPKTGKEKMKEKPIENKRGP